MPTLLDLAGVEIPKGLDGRSFKKQIFEPEVISNEFDVVYSQNQFGRMVRYDQFKYVRSVVYGTPYESLFNIENDPNESTNLINDPRFNDKLVKGRKLLDDWLKTEKTKLIEQR